MVMVLKFGHVTIKSPHQTTPFYATYLSFLFKFFLIGINHTYHMMRAMFYVNLL